MSALVEKAPPSPAASRPLHFHTSTHPVVRKWLIGLTLLLVVGWLVTGAIFAHFWLRQREAAGPLPAAESKAAETKAELAAGKPWGKLETAPIMIAPPLEFMPETAPADTEQATWHFSGMNAAEAGDFLRESGVSDEVTEKLRPLMQLDPATGNTVARPSREFILGLSPADRAKLYVALGQFRENADQANAYRFHGDTFAQWMEHTSLPAASRALVEPLVYNHGGYVFFADLRSIETQLKGDARMYLLKDLSREASFLVKLEVDTGDDLESIINYWSRGGRTKDIRPLIESLARAPGRQKIDIIHLLPRFARARIFTYPPPPEKQPALNRDCHWSSFNFFNLDADDRFCNDAEVVRTLSDDYYRVYSNLQLGDIVMYFVGDRTIHSCVYLADDIVFTKNGNTSSRPWMFMHLDDMKTYYPTVKPLEVRYYRKKDV